MICPGLRQKEFCKKVRSRLVSGACRILLMDKEPYAGILGINGCNPMKKYKKSWPMTGCSSAQEILSRQ